MATTVVKLIGTGGDYSSLSTGLTDWEAAKPTDLTQSRTGQTTQAGSTSSTIVLDSGATTGTTAYVGHAVSCDARPTEIRLITAYDGTTKIATIGAYRDTTESASSATWANTPGTEAYTIDTCIWQGRVTNCAMTSGVTVAGSTSSSTCYTELTAAIGASFLDNANAQTNLCSFVAANGASIAGANPILWQETGKLSKLMALNTYNYGKAFSVTSQTIDINQCIFESTAVDPTVAKFYGAGVTVRNSLVIQRRGGLAYMVQLENGAKAYNCTFVCPSNFTKAIAGVRGAYSAATMKNCAVFGATTDTTNLAPTATTCYTDDTTPSTGFTGSIAYTTATFKQTTDTGRDFKLVAGSSLLNVGTTDATNAATDIVGTGRPQGSAYDVGCWEYVRPPQRVMRLFAGFKIQFKSGILRIR